MFYKGQSTKSLCLALYMVVICTEDQLRHNSGINIGLGSYACYTCILLLRFGKFTIWNPQLSLLSYTTILNFNHNTYIQKLIQCFSHLLKLSLFMVYLAYFIIKKSYYLLYVPSVMTSDSQTFNSIARCIPDTTHLYTKQGDT